MASKKTVQRNAIALNAGLMTATAGIAVGNGVSSAAHGVANAVTSFFAGMQFAWQQREQVAKAAKPVAKRSAAKRPVAKTAAAKRPVAKSTATKRKVR